MFLPNLRLMRPLSLKKVSLMIPSLFEIFHLNGIVTNMRDAASVTFQHNLSCMYKYKYTTTVFRPSMCYIVNVQFTGGC